MVKGVLHILATALLVTALARGRSLEDAATALVPYLKTTPAAVAAGAGAGVLLGVLAAACVRVVGRHLYPEGPYRGPQGSRLISVLHPAAAIVLWPAAEALVVRGVVIAGLVAPAWGMPMAIAASLPILALMAPPWLSPVGFVLSAALTGATLVHGSLWPPLAAHIVCQSTLLLLAPRTPQPMPAPPRCRPTTPFGRAVLLHRMVTAAVVATAVGKAAEAAFRAMGKHPEGEMVADYLTDLASVITSAAPRENSRWQRIFWRIWATRGMPTYAHLAYPASRLLKKQGKKEAAAEEVAAVISLAQALDELGRRQNLPVLSSLRRQLAHAALRCYQSGGSRGEGTGEKLAEAIVQGIEAAAAMAQEEIWTYPPNT